MNARQPEYSNVHETKWYDAVGSIAKKSSSWDKGTLDKQDAQCELAGYSSSIAIQSDVLSTFIRIVEDKDTKTLALAASRARELELLAEARLRFALHQDEAKVHAPHAPAWVELKLSQLENCLPVATTSAGKILAELEKSIALDREAIDFQPGPDGAVIVALGKGCRWFVYSPRLPWPGCDVRFYAPEEPDSAKLQVEHHRLARTLVDSTARHIVANER